MVVFRGKDGIMFLNEWCAQVCVRMMYVSVCVCVCVCACVVLFCFIVGSLYNESRDGALVLNFIP